MSSFGKRLLLGYLLAITGSSAVYAQRDLTEIPQPDPVVEVEAMRVDPAMQVNLFAADPQIRKPIQSNFDRLGRLWVASSKSYPQLAPGEVANDEIVVLEDADHDGVAEKSTVFADGLLIPTGVLPDGPHAAYVAHATELIYLEDTDHDGKADSRRIVLSGFGTEDTHHLIHTLRWGHDGCVYFNQSIYIHSTVETAYGVRKLDGGGIWRYRPETGELQVLCKGFVNPWGHVFDAYGQSLATDGAYFEGINHVFPDSVFVTSPGATRWLSGMNPGSPKHCGLTVLSGPHVPAGMQGDLVTNDFRSHRVCRFTLTPQGSSYQSRQQPEVIVSRHIAFRPIDAGMGGDGALYISDWYNPIIQHGEVDFRDERRDREHGRIWRVTFKGQPLDQPRRYADLNTDGLVVLLGDSSLAARQFARLELKGRERAAVAKSLDQWIAAAEDSHQRDLRVMEGMWIDECHNVVNPDRLRAALAADDGRIRAAAMRVVHWRRAQLENADAILAAAVRDPHPQVRLEAVAALGNGQSAKDIETALVVLEQPMDANIDFSLWNAARQLSPLWLPALAAGKLDFGGQPKRLEFLLNAAGSPQAAEPVIANVLDSKGSLQLNDAQAAAMVRPLAGVADAGQIGRLVQGVFADRQWQPQQRADLLAAIVDQTSRRGLVPQGVEGRIVDAIADENGGNIGQIAVVAAGAWKLAQAVPALQQRLAKERQQPERIAAVQALLQALGQIGSAEANAVIATTAEEVQGNANVRGLAVSALAGSDRGKALELFTSMLADTSARNAAIDQLPALLQRQGLADELADRLSKLELAADDARRMMGRARGVGGSEKLAEAIKKAGQLENAGWKWSDELSNEILQLAQTSGDAVRGEAVYRREAMQCIQCHAIGEAGGLVGPNLVSLGGAATAEYILRSLIDPNDKLKEGYTTTRVLTLDGRLLQGIAAGGDDESLRLRLADGKVVDIPLNDIEEQTPGQSLMPVGLVDPLTKQELADLVRFLAALGREPEYSVGTRQLVRACETLKFTPEANHQMNRTSTDAVVSDDPAFQWRPLTSRVNGTLPVAEMDAYRQHQGIPASSFVRFTIDVGDRGAAGLEITPLERVQMWVDGRPTPTTDLKGLTLAPGQHTIVIGINRDMPGEGIVIERL